MRPTLRAYQICVQMPQLPQRIRDNEATEPTVIIIDGDEFFAVFKLCGAAVSGQGLGLPCGWTARFQGIVGIHGVAR